MDCLDESENWSSSEKVAEMKNGPYRIQPEQFIDKVACVTKCYYDHELNGNQRI